MTRRAEEQKKMLAERKQKEQELALEGLRAKSMSSGCHKCHPLGLPKGEHLESPEPSCS